MHTREVVGLCLFGYRWAAEGLEPWPCLGQKKILKYIPGLGQHPQFYYLVKGKDKMHTVLFFSHLLAIAID